MRVSFCFYFGRDNYDFDHIVDDPEAKILEYMVDDYKHETGKKLNDSILLKFFLQWDYDFLFEGKTLGEKDEFSREIFDYEYGDFLGRQKSLEGVPTADEVWEFIDHYSYGYHHEYLMDQLEEDEREIARQYYRDEL